MSQDRECRNCKVSPRERAGDLEEGLWHRDRETVGTITRKSRSPLSPKMLRKDSVDRYMFYRKGTWREVGRKGPAQIMGKCDSKGHAGLERQEWFSGTVFQFQSFWEKIKAKKKEEVLFRTERGTRRVCTWGVWYFLSNRCLRLCSFLLFNRTVVFCSLSGLKTQICHVWTWISDLMCTYFPLPISGLREGGA